MNEAQPSRTALRVALRRAAHQLHDAEPLVFRDPLAVRILSRELRDELRFIPDARRKPYSASLRAWMVARSRFAEDTLAAAVSAVPPARPARQYLLLGAGLDTFPYRNPFPDLRVFEVDHPATQAWKLGRLAEAGIAIPPSVRLVPVDFERQSLGEELTRAGFSTTLPTVTAWLGVVPYLTREAFRLTVAWLGRLPSGSQLVFDYSLPREALPPVEQQYLDSLSQRVAQAGEPFRLFFRPEELAAELAAAGLRMVEDLRGPDINARYFADRHDGLALRGQGARLCLAEVACS